MHGFEALSLAARRLGRALPRRRTFELAASAPPGEVVAVPALPPAVADILREQVVPALLAMEAALPLERDVDGQAWERLVLHASPERGGMSVSVMNAMGLREYVTRFGLSAGHGTRLRGWAGSRTSPRDGGTSWDDARRQGRLVIETEAFGLPAVGYVDAGCHRIMEMAAALGARTRFSCEGHPDGAYLVVDPCGAGDELARALAAAGWRVDQDNPWGRHGCYMPKPATMDRRDAAWRRTCCIVEQRLGLARDAGREALRAINIHPGRGPGPGSPTDEAMAGPAP